MQIYQKYDTKGKIIMENNTIITDAKDFNIKQTLECGELFRYELTPTHAVVYTLDKKAILYQEKDKIIIENEDKDYFTNYFDLNCDYSKIKQALNGLPMMDSAMEYGYGIRILRQDIVETIISFIISANNNIPRIRGILNKICQNNKFPQLVELGVISENDFKAMGAGYRASYLNKTIKILLDNKINLSVPYRMNGFEANKYLCDNLVGVGPKVADCILLFAYHKMDVFPVDTWVKKIYSDLFNQVSSPKIIRQKLIDLYGEYSGYAQQYLFYNKRSGSKE